MIKWLSSYFALCAGFPAMADYAPPEPSVTRMINTPYEQCKRITPQGSDVREYSGECDKLGNQETVEATRL